MLKDEVGGDEIYLVGVKKRRKKVYLVTLRTTKLLARRRKQSRTRN